MDVILEIDTRINLNTRAGVIVHDIFKRQQCVHRLEMIGQTIIGSIEIEPLIFDACPEIPLPSNEEAMSVAKVVVERIAVAKFAVVVEETAVAGIVQFVIKKLAVIFFRRRGGRLDLVRRCAGNDGRGDSNKQADKE